ncbi:MAG: Fmu (Sun) domain-containing protein [Chitinophagales bacterium]
MQRIYSYLNTAVKIIGEYEGIEPFSSFLKKYFSQYKKYGSNDRKQITHLCFCYFRLGKSAPPNPPQRGGLEERILTGLFLCSSEPNEIFEKLQPEWNKQIDLPVSHKLLIINDSLLIETIFPWKDELSNEINYEKFCGSFFIQPDLFLRLRPGCENAVRKKLSGSKIHFTEINESCLSLRNNSKIENIIELDKEAVVQDYNSQGTGTIFKTAINHLPSVIHAWDCCAASGGKSLLLYDINSTIDLTVSDIRESILMNLKKRFARAGIKKYRSFIADLSRPDFKIQNSKFELIICDAPCTGSGTWNRTPEQLYFFNEKKIREYSSLQKQIVSNVVPCLKENGFLIYITCSVFKKENEEIADFVENNFKLKLIKMELLKGYDKKADTMFVTLFKNIL